MDDSTIAVEVAASQALLQWPYLADTSLIDAVASVFKRTATPLGTHPYKCRDIPLLYI